MLSSVSTPCRLAFHSCTNPFLNPIQFRQNPMQFQPLSRHHTFHIVHKCLIRRSYHGCEFHQSANNILLINQYSFLPTNTNNQAASRFTYYP